MQNTALRHSRCNGLSSSWSSLRGGRPFVSGCAHRPVNRGLTVRRTSEHWWEDEEEFDAITELVVPKRLHIAIVAAGPGTAEPMAPAATTTAAPSGGDSTTVWCGASEAAVEAMALLSRRKFASGFASAKSRAAADALWTRLGQDGPPFFKKVRTRAVLDELEEPATAADRVAGAAEELWRELCGQTWRVELDYGLEGSDDPRDDLLLACSGVAAARLLAHAGLQADAASRGLGYALVDVPGYNASERGEPLRSWAQLQPRLLPTTHGSL